MDIVQFITASIREITAGIVQARDELKNEGILVAPSIPLGLIQQNQASKLIGHLLYGKEAVYVVEFDIAIVVHQEEGQQAKLGVFAGAFGVGGGISSQQKDGSVSRVKFSVPITYPSEENIENTTP